MEVHRSNHLHNNKSAFLSNYWILVISDDYEVILFATEEWMLNGL